MQPVGVPGEYGCHLPSSNVIEHASVLGSALSREGAYVVVDVGANNGPAALFGKGGAVLDLASDSELVAVPVNERTGKSRFR